MWTILAALALGHFSPLITIAEGGQLHSCLMRCFLSSYGGAPFGAQLGGIMIISMVTGIGIVAGIGREFRDWARGEGWRWGWRRGGLRRWVGLGSAFGALALFGWWLSAA